MQQLEKIISGGQTGVDRAALDVAIKENIPHGGWCPKGRKAEDGIIDKRYRLQETDSEDYSMRTQLNVRDADGTLILNSGELEGGTALTAQYAEQIGKPLLIINLDNPPDNQSVYEWLNRHRIRILNVAGPRESKCSGIQSLAERFLAGLLAIKHK